jgi:2-iminobutanoate/2-iminopropanoate deaminase
MELKRVNTSEAPQPIGPYSQAVVAGGMVYTAGQIPLHPKTGEVCNSSFEAEARCVLDNLVAVLKAAGSSIDNAVKVTIYLKNMERFAELNEIYTEYFGKSCPARSTVQAARLPKDVEVEIDVIAAQL